MVVSGKKTWVAGWPTLWIYILTLIVASFSAEVSYSILEELKPGAFVGDVGKAFSLDVTTIAKRNPQVVSESYANYFEVSPNGLLVIRQIVDRENLCGLSLSCYLTFQLAIQSPLELHRIVVELLDVNDNSPQFSSDAITIDISEAAAPGTRFRLESAHDLDIGVNSLHTYLLSLNDYFTLKVQSKSDGSKFPELVLDKALDRETQAVFKLSLTAIDGDQSAKSGTTMVIINVMDVNDNAPFFDHPLTTVSLLENSPPGTLVTQLNASDPDNGTNGDIYYLFSKYTSETAQQLFTLDHRTGEIVVKGEVDYELASIHDITVQARDRGIPAMESSCHIKIQILDVNDNDPKIIINTLSKIVQEDVDTGTVIALITIIDEDAGKNGEVDVLLPPGLPFRLISPFEGHYTLVTDGPLDREAVSEYTIVVTATDLGSPRRSTRRSFVVTLSDVNDNAPLFSQSSYTVDIAENNAPGALLLTLSASDRDLGQNGQLSFSLLDSAAEGSPVSSLVYVNSENGNLYAMRALDHEQTRAFRVEVQARDAGVPARGSNVTVHVFVTDQNDHRPTVIYPALPPDGVLRLAVSRSADVGHLVHRVVCVDPDSGHNAWLSYSLGGPDASLFHVGAHTGEVRTARRLEEGDAAFAVVLLVQDNGQPSLSTSVPVNITVSETGAADLSAPHRTAPPRRGGAPNPALALIGSLACVSAVCLLAIVAMATRWLRDKGYLARVGLAPKPAPRSHKDLHLQVNAEGPLRYVEVVGGPRDHGSARRFYPTLSSSVKDFVFVKSPAVNQNTMSVTLSNKLMGKSTKRQQKPQPNDWRFTMNQRPGPSGGTKTGVYLNREHMQDSYYSTFRPRIAGTPDLLHPGTYKHHSGTQQRWTPYGKARAGPRPEEAGVVVAGTGPWPNPPTEAEQLQALIAAANEVSEATATLGPRYNAQFPMQHVPDYRQNVYIPGSTATLTANPQQQLQLQQQQQQQQQQALPAAQAMPQVDAPKAAQTPASKKKSTKKDKK